MYVCMYVCMYVMRYPEIIYMPPDAFPMLLYYILLKTAQIILGYVHRKKRHQASNLAKIGLDSIQRSETTMSRTLHTPLRMI
ncbi:hypothetical protein BDV38DRAFT_120531 [Aspergillus pseudotamarii]|uniref:Uncharacterized protein n=1 Tax=Aspergillus pseudotamarii TaxID=132259 RepID=A0A5N6SMN8_ASPPS|nr:uncharacterized protein BDV38DRAFT_120531 [Aspergillus pseudotamarii]KAE8135942.1 hypothetical protein BDV38DRAFT_120531 [Aspergillus pseudotamarii]